MTFFEPKKARSRRNEIRGEVRRDRPGPVKKLVDQAGSVRGERGMLTLTVAITFAVIASSILMLRPRVVDYRPGQVTTEPVFARVEFDVLDEQRLGQARQRAADAKPRVYRPADDDPFAKLEDDLLASPSRSTGLMQDQLAGDATQKVGLVTVFDANDGAALARLQGFTGERAGQWQRSVRLYVDALRDLGLILLPADAAAEDGRQPIQLESGQIVLAGQRLALPADEATRQEIERRVNGAAFEAFGELLYPKIVAFTSQTLQPTVVPDLAATARVRGEASARVPESAGELVYREGQRLLPRGHRLDESDWQLLRAENDSYRASLGNRVWFERTGLAGLAILLTVAMSAYVLHYRPKIAANPSRAAGLATLLLGCLLIAQLAALGTGSLVLLALGPIFLAGITLSVAYDGRFALGIGGLLALLVTLALGQGVGFFLVACAGLLPACLMPGEVRTRSRLIEVGGTVGIIAGAAALVAGLARMEPLSYLLASSAWAALAGFGAGGLVLCVLPFIERAFRITTGLTLLEYLDHPLLRRLAMEAPGTYNHSLQVATISEEAAKAINADGLLCRVACYYHDVGKLRKPEYFIENQRANEAAGGNDPVPRVGGENPHLSLNPSMSLLVITGHVKDGLAMAREWGLPRAFLPFIEQHHGTTLVEYFYREAVQQQQRRLEAAGDGPLEPDVAEGDYRYPGPRPRSRETAIVMIADTCESACRAMADPTPTRLESRVSDLVQKRLLDGQFDECPITMGELEIVKRSIIKSLVGIYHGRVPYPEDKPTAVTPAATMIGVRPSVPSTAVG